MSRMPDSRYDAEIDALEERYSNERLIREIAAAVITMRKTAGWTQGEVAKNIRGSQGMMSRIERAVTVRPKWDALECMVHNLRWKLVLKPGPGAVVRVEARKGTLRNKPPPRANRRRGPSYGKPRR